MALTYLLMILIHRHYNQVREELALRPESDRALPSRVRSVVLVQQVNLPTAKAIAYAKAGRATSLMGVTIAVDDEEARDLMAAWRQEDFGIPLRVIASPYREITQPFIQYVAEMRTENPRDVVAVYIPRLCGRALVGEAASQPDDPADPHPAALHERGDGDFGAVPAQQFTTA